MADRLVCFMLVVFTWTRIYLPRFEIRPILKHCLFIKLNKLIVLFLPKLTLVWNVLSLQDIDLPLLVFMRFYCKIPVHNPFMSIG